VCECDREASILRRPWPNRSCCATGKKYIYRLISVFSWILIQSDIMEGQFKMLRVLSDISVDAACMYIACFFNASVVLDFPLNFNKVVARTMSACR
jgi:hypothetical protein